jgi:hypothetical protein
MLGRKEPKWPYSKIYQKMEIKKYGIKIYNLSWHLPRTVGIYVISRNPIKLRKIIYDKSKNLEAFGKKFGRSIIQNS